MLNFKNADAMIFSIGIIKDHIRVSYSYEKVMSNIRFYAPVTHEFGIQFALTNKRQQMGRVYLFPKMGSVALIILLWPLVSR